MSKAEDNRESATIPLSRGFSVIVDVEDIPMLSQYKWYFTTCKTSIYAQARTGRKKRIYMHRLITNANTGQSIDHINGNGLDNRKSNLRFATSSENQQNSKKRKNCSSQYKGLAWNKNSKKWIVRLCKKGSGVIYLGLFTSEIEAAMAYDKKAKEIFGQYANLNFPSL